MWAKYSGPLSARAKLNDPKTHAPAAVNVCNSTEYGNLLPNGSATMDALIKQGVHFAVCDQSTHGSAGGFARTTDGKADAIYKELTSNLIGNSHMVPSGIVAIGHGKNAAMRTRIAADAGQRFSFNAVSACSQTGDPEPPKRLRREGARVANRS